MMLDEDPGELPLWPGGGGGEKVRPGVSRRTIRNLIFLLVFTWSDSSGVIATPYEHYELSKELLRSVVYEQKDNAPNHCYCKVSCTLESECTAVTVVDNDDGTVNCLYSNTQVSKISDTQPMKKAVTFFKTDILHQGSIPLEQPSKLTTGSIPSTSTESTTSTAGSTTSITQSIASTTQSTTSTTQSTTSTTQSTTSITQSTTTTEALACKTHFNPVPNVGCVRVVNQKTSWTSARSWCEARQADLFVAATEEKFEDFRAYVRNFMGNYNNVWVKVKNGKWNEGRDVTVNEWAASEPTSGDNCAGVAKSEGYKLAEKDCNSRSRFACWHE